MQPRLNIAFAGTPDFAATILKTLLKDRTHAVSFVYTQQDKPAGRGRKVQKSMVKEIAEANRIEVRQPENRQQLLMDDDLLQIDVMVVAAYGMLLPEMILKRPRFGCINIHTSLLPRWRGAAPVQRAILAGDAETGITIMQMDAGLDTGDILYQQSCQIDCNDTAGILTERLANIGSDCILHILNSIAAGTTNAIKQPDIGATYAHKVHKSDVLIDWHLPAAQIDRQIRAYNPEPVAYTVLNNRAIRIWQSAILDTPPPQLSPGNIIKYSAEGLDVTTGDKVIRILRLQLPGKKVLNSRDFFNGNSGLWTGR